MAERRFSTGARLQHYIRPLETSLEETSLDEKTDSVDSVSVKTITDAPQGSVIVSHVPAKIIDDSQ